MCTRASSSRSRLRAARWAAAAHAPTQHRGQFTGASQPAGLVQVNVRSDLQRYATLEQLHTVANDFNDRLTAVNRRIVRRALWALLTDLGLTRSSQCALPAA